MCIVYSLHSIIIWIQNYCTHTPNLQYMHSALYNIHQRAQRPFILIHQTIIN